LRAGSQFREKAQRYHNPILSNVRRRKMRSCGRRMPRNCMRASRWKGWRRYV